MTYKRILFIYDHVITRRKVSPIRTKQILRSQHSLFTRWYLLKRYLFHLSSNQMMWLMINNSFNLIKILENCISGIELDVLRVMHLNQMTFRE